MEPKERDDGKGIMRRQMMVAFTGINAFLSDNRYIIVIVIVGAVFRFAFLGAVPPGVWSDEAVPWSGTLKFIDGFSLLYRTVTITTYLEILFDGLLLSIKTLGPSTLSGRLPGAVFGLLLIPLTYMISREFFAKNVSLLASLLAALSPLGIEASRAFYMQQPLVSLFWLSLGAYLILNGVHKKRYLRLTVGILIFGMVIDGIFSNQTTFTGVILLVLLLLWGFKFSAGHLSLIKRTAIFAFVPLIAVLLFVFGLGEVDKLYMASNIHYTPLNSSLYFSSNNIFISEGIRGLPIFLEKYVIYFSPIALFVNGGPDPSVGVAHAGALLYAELPFFYFGLIYFIYRAFRISPKDVSKFPFFFFLVWALTSPVEVSIYSLTNLVPWSINFISALPSLNIISASGFFMFLAVLRERSLVRNRETANTSRERKNDRLIISETKGLHFKRGRKIIISIFIAALLVSSSVFGYFYFVEHPDRTVNDPNSQWGVFYGLPQIAVVSSIAEDYLFSSASNGNGAPIYIYSAGFFNNSTVWGSQASTFNYYYYSGVFTDYFYYYSGGKISTTYPLYSLQYVTFNRTSLIVTTQEAVVEKELAGEGYGVVPIYSIKRPDGQLALSLIEVKVQLTPSEYSFVNGSLLVDREPGNSEYLNFTGLPAALNFTVGMRITVKTLDFYNYSDYTKNPVIFVIGNSFMNIGIRMIPTSKNNSSFSYYWQLFLRNPPNQTFYYGGTISQNVSNGNFTVVFTVEDGLGILFVDGKPVLTEPQVIKGLTLSLFANSYLGYPNYIGVSSILVFDSALNLDEISYISSEWLHS